ncbi:O-antigen ligase family protein [Phenylobacterium deserti]|uniref:O-antigen ligase-related domain-containing protein n=1 Tax=Phenylobacterium deserti TaxID=1914756 RepID=A0A328AV95_9CAUL|nr:O-antigen ligase family protein [Phenylobacterium deserti]RAK58135.1 hypothetical protein DJ018_09580 [Phenylobacterium deserti]
MTYSAGHLAGINTRSQRAAPSLQALAGGSLFFLAILLSVGAMTWTVGGMPVRAAPIVGGILVLAAIDPRIALNALHRQCGFLLLIAGVALLAIVISLLNGIALPKLARELVEIHVQSALFLVFTTMVASVCGGTTVVLLFVAAVGVSAAFAVAQFVGLEVAWSARDTIADLTRELVRYDRSRPPGLANTPIALATHLTLAFAALLIWRQRLGEAAGAPRRFDPVAVGAIAAFSVACLASGNRSPILGAALFLAIYSAVRAPKAFLLASPLVIMAIPLAGMAFEALQSTGLRAFTTGDKSSEGRETLIYYGLQLLRERPIGYGLGFDPTLYWGDHADFLLQFPNPGPVTQFELHNYVLTMLNYYGIGILMFVPPVILMARRNATVLLAFLPYAIHIMFHNYGPLAKNDALVFTLFAIAMAPMALKPKAPAPAARPARNGPTSYLTAAYPRPPSAGPHSTSTPKRERPQWSRRTP